MASINFAKFIGVAYLFAGLLGFVPAFVGSMPADRPGLVLESGYGYLLGLFPINFLHNIVHIGVGVWGLSASRSVISSIGFARGLAVFYGTLAAFGLIPGMNTTLGLIPLFGHDVWLHGLTALAAAYYGFYWTDASIDLEDTMKKAA